MSSFFVSGWLPVLTDFLVLRRQVEGWHFRQVADRGKCYVAYKFLFSCSSSSLKVTGLEICYRDQFNFRERIDVDYHKDSDIETRESVFHKYYQNTAATMIKCSVNCGKGSGILKIKCSCSKSLSDAQQHAVAVLVLTLIRDLFHIHFHHPCSADSCLEPIVSRREKSDRKIIECIKEQYRKKAVDFKRQISKIVKHNEKINIFRIFSKNCNQGLAYMENYRGELIYARSFILRCQKKDDAEKSFLTFLDLASDSFKIKYQYCTDIRNHFLSRRDFFQTFVTLIVCTVTLVWTIVVSMC